MTSIQTVNDRQIDTKIQDHYVLMFIRDKSAYKQVILPYGSGRPEPTPEMFSDEECRAIFLYEEIRTGDSPRSTNHGAVWMR